MQRANAEYTARMSSILNNAIDKLSLGSDGSVESSKLARDLEALRMSTLSVILQDETLRSDIHKIECEQSTKKDELCRLKAKLHNTREARKERRAELDNELSVLRVLFDEKQHQMVEEHDLVEQSELSGLRLQQAMFDKELEAMNKEKQELLKQQEEAKSEFIENESNIKFNIARLTVEIQRLSHVHETASKTKLSDIESIRTQLEQQKMQHLKMESHFKMVDLNNAIMKQEEEQLRKVAEIEAMALALLSDSALALQKLWRGSKDRKLVATMKGKQSKKGGKTKKKK